MFVPLYICIFMYEFYLGYIIRTQYMICSNQEKDMFKKIARKNLTKKSF